MNIFALDRNPRMAAQGHCDKHVVKMILESVQMMNTVAHKYGFDTIYKPIHPNHPCTLWIAESQENWDWLTKLVIHLHEEYQFRYGMEKIHNSFVVMKKTPVPDLPMVPMTEFVQCMPAEYKCRDSVQAYRNYYRFGKENLHQYTRRKKPFWMQK